MLIYSTIIEILRRRPVLVFPTTIAVSLYEAGSSANHMLFNTEFFYEKYLMSLNRKEAIDL